MVLDSFKMIEKLQILSPSPKFKQAELLRRGPGNL